MNKVLQCILVNNMITHVEHLKSITYIRKPMYNSL